MANEEKKILADAMRDAAEYASIDIDGFATVAEFLLEDITAEIERMEEANLITKTLPNRIKDEIASALFIISSIHRSTANLDKQLGEIAKKDRSAA